MKNSYPEFFEFDFYVAQLFLLASIVLLILLVAPRVKSKKYITSPIFFLVLGMALFLLPIPWDLPELIDEPVLLKRITEFGVIVALASAGLKINDPFSWKTWNSSARLLLITMPLTIALALFPYAAAELVSSYGFIAVFVSACFFRQKRPEHEYQKRVHRFSVTMEGLLEGILMLIIGGYLVFGVLKPLTFSMMAVSLAIIFLVRPVSGLIAFTGSDLPKHKKWIISFFGIRGIGSLYYLSYAIYMADFLQSDELWAMTIFIVAVSVFVHGVSAKPIMERFAKNE